MIGRSAAVALAALLLGVVAPVGTVAQSPLTLEVRAGRAFPVEDFRGLSDSGDRLTADHAFSVRFDLERSSHFSVMVGFDQFRTTCSGPGCGVEEQWVSTQWQLGSRWRRRSGSVRPWLSGAIVLPKVERDVGEEAEISHTAVGVEAGAGLLIRMTDRWYLSPGVRWTRYRAEFTALGQVPVRFAIADLGLLIAF